MNPEEQLKPLIDVLQDPSVKYLLGNHDMQYLFPDIEALGCSGWRMNTAAAFEKLMTPAIRERMLRLHCWIETEKGTWLVSHAGLHPTKAQHPVTGVSREWIDRICETALDRIKRHHMDNLLAAGERRGGLRGEIGGITWLDWRDFVPVEGLNQVVGHTPGNEIRSKVGPNSVNYAIDTHLERVLIISSDGEVFAEAA
jgi:hypothetical protein